MAYTTINKSTDHFNTKIYTGDGSSSRDITGVGFQPDLLWIKNRDITQWSFMFDAVRGASQAIFPNVTSAESTQASTQTAFLSDGFTVGNDEVSNGNGQAIASWNWKANGAGSANTVGDIASTVSANTTSGFSIVKYTGTGVNATVGHGLGSAPSMIIFKTLNDIEDWGVYHKSIGAGNFLRFNEDDSSSAATTVWNNTAPTDSVFSLGTSGLANQNNINMIAYCFAEKTGYSKFGSYTGNGQTGRNAPFIYTGFKPSFLIVKKTTTAASRHWILWDNKRSTKNGFNIIDKKIYVNLINAEDGALDVSFLSNGFKFNTNQENWNESQENYIYMAFAEAPLVGSNNVPATAR